MTSALSTRTEGGILEVTLDRPKANAINLTTSREMGEIFAELCHTVADHPAIRFDLGVSGTTEKAETTPLPLKVGPAPYKPTSLIIEMGEFDL